MTLAMFISIQCGTKLGERQWNIGLAYYSSLELLILSVAPEILQNEFGSTLSSYGIGFYVISFKDCAFKPLKQVGYYMFSHKVMDKLLCVVKV